MLPDGTADPDRIPFVCRKVRVVNGHRGQSGTAQGIVYIERRSLIHGARTLGAQIDAAV